MHIGWKGGIIYKLRVLELRHFKRSFKNRGETKELFVTGSQGTHPKDPRKSMLG